MINTGSNPLSRIEVVSTLNTLNISKEMLHYNTQNCPPNYYPKVYLGTSQTTAQGWLYERINGEYISMNNWPQAYQGTQKGCHYNSLIILI